MGGMGTSTSVISGNGLVMHVTLCALGWVTSWDTPFPLAVSLLSCVTGLIGATIRQTQQQAVGTESTINVSALGPKLAEEQTHPPQQPLDRFLVLLAPAENLVGEAVALMANGLTVLTYWGPLCQLSLGTEVQSEAETVE